MLKYLLSFATLTAAIALAANTALYALQKGHGGGSPGAGGPGMMTPPAQTPMPSHGTSSTNPGSGNQSGSMGNPNGSASHNTGSQNSGSMTHEKSAPATSQNSAQSSTAPGQQTASEQLASNPKLSSHVQSLFPAGTNLSTAADGFKNMGDFVAAAHVSHNLGIPFDQLKTKVVGGEELGQAIHDLRPDVNSKSEAARATKQAGQTMKGK